MKKLQFELLCSLLEEDGAHRTQRDLAADTGMSLGSVSAHLSELQAQGLVDGERRITEAGHRALEPYRITQAIILAAGVGSRLAPLSYERPKAMFEVRGQVLIERLIAQLREAGIEDIAIVVGYRKEEFFYLAEKHGVRLIVNADYATSNSASSLLAARDSIRNAYVCASDQYFERNPFASYAFESYLSVVPYEGQENAAPVSCAAGGLVRRARTTTKGALTPQGPAYFDRATLAAFMALIEDDLSRPEARSRFWEVVLIDHLRELRIRAKRIDPAGFFEFNSLSDLMAFDADFLANVDSSILDNICATLDCTRSEIGEVETAKAGLTNLSVLFSVRGERYVYRHPGPGTNAIVNRAAEAYALTVARKLGLDGTFVHEDPEGGWKISRFLPGCTPFDYRDRLQVERAFSLVRRLHESGESSPWSFDFWDEANRIIELLRESGYPLPADFEALFELMGALACHVRAEASEPVLCHNDFYGPNLLVHGDEMQLIDWEYSAMGDYAGDIGNFIAQGSGYTVPEAIECLSAYFGRAPSPEEERHCLALTALVGFYWYVWAIYKGMQGNPVGDWLYLWYRAARTYGEHALPLYEGGLTCDSAAQPCVGEAGGEGEGARGSAPAPLAGIAGGASSLGVPAGVDDAPEAEAPAEGASLPGALSRERFDELVAKEAAGSATPEERAALEPYRARRAILMAAGFGSRMLPLTVNTPKPLVRVHGVRIIDRLIDALLAVGIEEIHVVRGYLAESFDQLLAKYPMLRFIDNPMFDRYNNISSAVVAKDLFRNAYVFESDLFLTDPSYISKYQYESNYLGFPVEATPDWCFHAHEDGLIEGIEKGSKRPCWQMVGLSYWSGEDGARLAEDIPAVFADEDARQIFWDDVALVRRREGYAVRVRPCDPEHIVEIDTFAELQDIDPTYRPPADESLRWIAGVRA